MRLIKRGISLEFLLWLQGLKRDAVTRLRVVTLAPLTASGIFDKRDLRFAPRSIGRYGERRPRRLVPPKL
jgi:hypothetical protein